MIDKITYSLEGMGFLFEQHLQGSIPVIVALPECLHAVLVGAHPSINQNGSSAVELLLTGSILHLHAELEAFSDSCAFSSIE